MGFAVHFVGVVTPMPQESSHPVFVRVVSTFGGHGTCAIGLLLVSWLMIAKLAPCRYVVGVLSHKKTPNFGPVADLPSADWWFQNKCANH